jgi:glutamine phosphoribosylpyrophosphate amidotransferase
MEMERGATLEDAMRASLDVLDGTYAYVAATENELGAAKDFMGARPLVIAETDEFVVVSSEAAAVCEGLEQDLVTWEPDAKEVHVWATRTPSATDTHEQAT